MTEEKRSFTVFIENGAAVRGYVKTHYGEYVQETCQIEVDGQMQTQTIQQWRELSSPRDVEMSAEQLAAVNAADLASVLG